MRRINTLNKDTDAFGAGKHGWKNGVPGTANRPTEGQAEWFNALQEEVAGAVEASGQAINPADNGQLLKAISALSRVSLRVDTVAALRGLAPPPDGTLVWLSGYYDAFDGGGGMLVWDADSVAADDGGVVFRPASAPVAGRWLRNDAELYLEAFGAVGDGATLCATQVATALVSGRTIRARAVAYRIDTLAVQHSNITLLGTRMPAPNGARTALVNGTIFKGELLIDGDNIRVEDIGCDFGNTYSNAYRGGNGGNGFVAHNIAQAGVINTNNHFKNIIGLCRIGNYTDMSAAFHGVLLESLQKGSAYNIVGVNGWFGVVLKVKDFNADALTGIENDTCSVYLKSNTYGSVERVNIGKCNSINLTARGYVGTMVQASDAELSTVNVDSVTAQGGNIPFKLEAEGGQPCVNVVIGKVTSRGTVAGVQVRGPIYGSRIGEVNVNSPTSGLGFETGANVAAPVPGVVNDLSVGYVRVVAPGGTNPATNLVIIDRNVSFDNIEATIGYGTPGKISVTNGGNGIGSYKGILSVNKVTTDLINGWTTAFAGQAVGSLTRNGRTRLYGRIKTAGATSDVFMSMNVNAFAPGLVRYGVAMGYSGGTGKYDTAIPVLIDGGTGELSIINRANYAGVSWILLDTVEFEAQMPVTGAI